MAFKKAKATSSCSFVVTKDLDYIAAEGKKVFSTVSQRMRFASRQMTF